MAYHMLSCGIYTWHTTCITIDIAKINITIIGEGIFRTLIFVVDVVDETEKQMKTNKCRV